MKIDCSKTVNFFKEKRRMCKTYYDCEIYDCAKCPMSEGNNYKKLICTAFMERDPEEAIEIVQKWSDEHPVKTRLEDLLEKYPNANTDNVVKNVCVQALGYKKGDCDFGRCEDCWNMPV